MYKKIISIFLLSLLLLAYQNCSEFKSADQTSLDSISNFTYIDENLIATSCASCHSGANSSGGVNLSTYSDILASGTVIEDNAEGSSFYNEIKTGEMPPEGEQVSSTLVQAVESWINNGAKENEDPIINPLANINLVLPNTSTNIVVNALDYDGTIDSYSWSQTSGPNSASLSGETSSSLSVTNLIIGSYTFSVTVTDDDGATASSSVNVVLTDAPNVAPSVSLGNDKNVVLPASSINLIASASDSDGSIVSYAWTQDAGPNTATLSGEASNTLATSNLIEGTYTFSVVVTDDDGATASDSVNVVVGTGPPTLSELRTNVFNAKCSGCHLGGASFGGYNMDTYAGLMTTVIAGNATASVLYTEVETESMPVGSNKLTQTEKNQVRDWINAGALDN